MKRREHILALVAGAIVLIAVAERLVLSPLRQAWQGLADRVSAERAALVSAEGLLKRADTVRARYRGSAGAVEGDPDTREIEFLAFLQASAGRAGVRVASEQPALVWRGQVAQGGRRSDDAVRYGECTVTWTFTSSVEALVRLLTELGAGKEPVRVRRLVLTAQDPAGRSLQVTLVLSTVVLPAEAPRLALPAAGPGPGPVAVVGLSGAGWGREGGERVEARP